MWPQRIGECLAALVALAAVTCPASAEHVIVTTDGRPITVDDKRCVTPLPAPTVDPCEPERQRPSQVQLENPDLAADTPTPKCTPTAEAPDSWWRNRAARAGAQTATDENGNIWVSDAGHKRQITNSGVDCCPALSPDGRQVAFVRKTVGDTYEGGREVYPNEIWIARVNHPEPRKLVRGGASGYGAVAALGSAQFSPDGRRVYFWREAAVTSGEVVAIEPTTGKITLISDGNEFWVILDATAYRGCLVVRKHKYFLFGGSYDWWWLLSATGKEIGPLGDYPTIYDDPAVDPHGCD